MVVVQDLLILLKRDLKKKVEIFMLSLKYGEKENQMIEVSMENKDKIILDLCGGTGAWSKPYRDAGYDVRIITLPKYDVRDLTTQRLLADSKPYGILMAPPCTYFSFCRTNARLRRRLDDAMSIVQACLNIMKYSQFNLEKDTQKKPPVRFWALENPKGMLEWFLGKPIYTFQPWEYGDMYKKNTCLWGYFNEPKKTNEIEPDVVKFDKLKTKEIHGEYYGKYDRTTRRAITPSGFAQAFYEDNK